MKGQGHSRLSRWLSHSCSCWGIKVHFLVSKILLLQSYVIDINSSLDIAAARMPAVVVRCSYIGRLDHCFTISSDYDVYL